MTLLIISVGRNSTGPIKELIDTYEKRLRPHVEIEWRIIAPAKENSIENCLRVESKKILGALKHHDKLILLDERGAMLDNTRFAEIFQEYMQSQGRLVFLVGGAYGVDKSIYDRADYKWSISSLVFPHQLIRLLIIEQIYRTVMINNGHPYHHM